MAVHEKLYTAADYFALDDVGPCELIDGYLVGLPPLALQHGRAGVRYTEEEFLALNDTGRCELINGHYYSLPRPSLVHQAILGCLSYLLTIYTDEEGLTDEPFMSFDVQLGEHTVAVPDIFLTCHPEKLCEYCLAGAPDLAVEIVSPEAPGHDQITKLHLYMEHGVREYWIVDPRDKSVTVYINDKGGSDEAHYAFGDDIPVHIYKDRAKPLIINIEEIMNELHSGWEQ